MEMIGKIVQTLAFLMLVNAGLSLPAYQASEPITPFRLTYTPGRVVTHVTRDVTLRCEDDVLQDSKLQEVSRIRVLKKALAGWSLVAELRDLEDKPRKTQNVTVTAKIGQDVRNTFLYITWDVATKETYGTYICEVIGFDKVMHSSAVELTSEVVIVEENVTSNDLLEVLRDLKRDVAYVEQQAKKYQDVMASFDTLKDDKLAKTGAGHHNLDIPSIQKDIDDLHSKISAVAKNFTSVTDNIDVLNNHTEFIDGTLRSLQDDVRQLNGKVKQLGGGNKVSDQSSSALAKDVSDIKKDFTLFGSEFKALEKIVEFLTVEMSSLEGKVGNLSGEIVSQNGLLAQSGAVGALSSPGAGTFQAFLQNFAKLSSWPDGKFAIPRPSPGCPLDVSFFGNRHMFLSIPIDDTTTQQFIFCESSREVISNREWPQGAYCVNMVPGLNCPDGLEHGLLDLSDAEAEINLFQGSSMSSSLGFCCKTSGYSDTPMPLPNHSEFILYRFGGRCQQVEGMDVEETIMGPVDTIDHVPFLITAGETPDIDLIGTYVIFHTCRYKKS